MPAALALMRPKQWTKNLLVFAALIFAGRFDDLNALWAALVCFVAMCLASSAVYVLNDLLDIERDRQHPTKRDRPLAAGRISVGLALGVGLASLGGGLFLAAWLNLSSLAILLTYLVVQLAYNFSLKRHAVADVFAIAVGFVLRAAIGAAAITAVISPWLLFCTGALALQLGFAKRRHELVLLGADAPRESLGSYSRGALDALVITSAGGAAVFYGIYSILSANAREHPMLFLTSLFVFYGISRYLHLVFSSDKGGEPESLVFGDPHMLVAILGFLGTALLAMAGYAIPIVDGYQP